MKRNQYDLIVVGAGIAGLAIGEIFARSGFKVALIEKNERICTEASGIHHEWFHFGSLYSIFPTNQFLRTMVGSIDDILLYYRDFDGMNLRVDAQGKLITINKNGKWFREDSIDYIVNTINDPDFTPSNNDSVQDKVKKIFFKWTWDKNIKQFIARHNRYQKYDWRRGCASHYIPKAGLLDYSRNSVHKAEVPDARLDTNTHIEVKSYDRPMNAYGIISDLTRSYISYGGHIFTNSSFNHYVQGPKRSKIYLNNDTELEAKFLILALGQNLERFAKGKIGVKAVASPLLVAYPHVCDVNFVRLTPFINKTINHLTHEINGRRYSLIGGGYFAKADSDKEKENARNALINRARKVFPKLADAKVFESYFGYKVEVSTSYSKRNYLYHIERIDDRVFIVVPGKFSLAFSLAVNTFHRLIGHYPNAYVVYDNNIDVTEWLCLMKHKNIVSDLVAD
ncbi:MAG: FAD-dependent oxidoreductase [Deltaproteobacteria bacterium]|nr:MAG: FAD-dependent oxidoreductase [Deltaproteobacteria bacterium]